MQNLGGTSHDLTLGFSHNPASQIAGNTRSNDAFSFTGHANVNRTDAVNGLNQVTATGGASISHDSRGSIANDGARSHAYSADNRLLVAPATTLAYDPAGRLFANSAEGGLYHYDGHNLIMATAQTGNAITRRYVHGPGIDEPIVWYEGSGTSDRRWLHADERGSIVAVSDGSGNLVGSGPNRYDEYGVPQGTLTGRFGYTGQPWLPELGLYYYRNRMYNPALGRFMQPDRSIRD